eukprot:6394079-Prymnesium_polylepis.1
MTPQSETLTRVNTGRVGQRLRFKRVFRERRPMSESVIWPISRPSRRLLGTSLNLSGHPHSNP